MKRLAQKIYNTPPCKINREWTHLMSLSFIYLKILPKKEDYFHHPSFFPIGILP